MKIMNIFEKCIGKDEIFQFKKVINEHTIIICLAHKIIDDNNSNLTGMFITKDELSDSFIEPSLGLEISYPFNDENELIKDSAEIENFLAHYNIRDEVLSEFEKFCN